MARNFFGIEKGLDVYQENGDLKLRILTGAGAPTATAEQNAAPLGSLYINETNGDLYQKKALSNVAGDWELNGSASAQLGNWRPERVDAHTGQVLTAGLTDPTTWSDNDDGTAAAAFTVGHYVLDGNCDLWEITAIAAPNITLVAAANPPVADDMFAVKYNMPDVAGQENQAIITYNGSMCIKVADADWGVANAIGLSGGYAAGPGDEIVSAADTVQSALQKIDGNQQETDQNVDDLITLSGVAENSVDLGTFTGVTIPDSSTVKGALQSIETAYEETDANVDDLITLSGVNENDTDLGTFTGDIISDNISIKNALQELETELVDTRDNTDDLITLSGVAENSVDLGAFASPGSFLLTATETIKSALQKLADYLFGVKVTQTVGVQALTVVDSVPHATYKRVQWIVEVFQTATPENRVGYVIDALTDGTSVDDTQYAKLKLGANIGDAVSVAINGANLELSVSATPSCTVNVRRITVI